MGGPRTRRGAASIVVGATLAGMDPMLAKLTSTARANEPVTERAVRCSRDRPAGPMPVPVDERGATLLRLWAQPERLVRPVHVAGAVSAVAKSRPRDWRRLWLSTAALSVFAAAEDGVPHGPDYAIAVAVAAVFLLSLTVTIWCISAFRLATAACAVDVHVPPLAHTAWEQAQPLDCEDNLRWAELAARAAEYVELRGHVVERRAPLRDAPSPEAEQVRFHLRHAALALRQHHAAQSAARTAAAAGDDVLAAVPAVRAEHALADFAEHLHLADEALAALRPVALAAQVDEQMRPLALPSPMNRTPKPGNSPGGGRRKRPQLGIQPGA